MSCWRMKLPPPPPPPPPNPPPPPPLRHRHRRRRHRQSRRRRHRRTRRHHRHHRQSPARRCCWRSTSEPPPLRRWLIDFLFSSFSSFGWFVYGLRRRTIYFIRTCPLVRFDFSRGRAIVKKPILRRNDDIACANGARLSVRAAQLLRDIRRGNDRDRSTRTSNWVLDSGAGFQPARIHWANKVGEIFRGFPAATDRQGMPVPQPAALFRRFVPPLPPACSDSALPTGRETPALPGGSGERTNLNDDFCPTRADAVVPPNHRPALSKIKSNN